MTSKELMDAAYGVADPRPVMLEAANHIEKLEAALAECGREKAELKRANEEFEPVWCKSKDVVADLKRKLAECERKKRLVREELFKTDQDFVRSTKTLERKLAECERESELLHALLDDVQRHVARILDLEHKLAECEQQRDALVGMDHLAEHYRKERDDAEQKLKQFAADTVEGMECLPTCDSTAHDELCPVAHPVEAWRVLRERLAECEQELITAYATGGNEALLKRAAEAEKTLAECERENAQLREKLVEFALKLAAHETAEDRKRILESEDVRSIMDLRLR